ncbi:hypothetical protein [Nostoc sp.]|uniref:hypothetical protein n=1 Tax=Nostoc sp. TaxID=1180 RepID=UPI002FF4FB7D
MDNYEKADAAAPLSRTFALSNSSPSDADVVPRQKQKVAGCLFGVCVDLPKIPVSISGIPGGDQKELIQQANPQSNVSLAGKWQSDWGSVQFNSNLTGHWNQGSGIGQIKDGTYDPKTRKLVFHYYQPWNDMNGTATLTLSEDGNRLLGTWTQQRASNPPGSGGSGGWTMTRDPSQQSVGDARKPLDGRFTIVSLAGKWQSNWGLVEFNSDLSGRWNQGVGIGQIKDGTYDPQTRKLVFHYYQPWNEMDGTTTMMLSEDGNQLSGTWIQQRGSNRPGSGGSGGWTMTRDPSDETAKAAEKGPRRDDIVVYRLNGEITHSGVISEVGSDHKTIIKVKSKWGTGSLYEHDPLDVPKGYGSWTAYHTPRQEHNLLKQTASGFDYTTDKGRTIDQYRNFSAWFGAWAKRFETEAQARYNAMKMSEAEYSGFASRLLVVYPTYLFAPFLNGSFSNEPTHDEIAARAELKTLSNRVKTIEPGPIYGYDCHGYTFTGGNRWIGLDTNHGKEVEIILEDNGYIIVPALDTKGFHHPV